MSYPLDVTNPLGLSPAWAWRGRTERRPRGLILFKEFSTDTEQG